uniref:Uncharacterized protein n=1 Tax=Cannabis sativa TaxID=3483 RepID=A0A803Q548_CANSA
MFRCCVLAVCSALIRSIYGFYWGFRRSCMTETLLYLGRNDVLNELAWVAMEELQGVVNRELRMVGSVRSPPREQR